MTKNSYCFTAGFQQITVVLSAYVAVGVWFFPSPAFFYSTSFDMLFSLSDAFGSIQSYCMQIYEYLCNIQNIMHKYALKQVKDAFICFSHHCCHYCQSYNTANKQIENAV